MTYRGQREKTGEEEEGQREKKRIGWDKIGE
jgi:hypothetical protein